MIPPFISNLFTGGLAKIGDSIKGIIDVSKFSAEEKADLQFKIDTALQAHEIELTKLAEQETEAYLKDTQSARDANAIIQNSSNASWLAKNVAYCLDIFIISVWGFLTIYLICIMLSIVKKQTGVDYTAVTAVWGGVTAFAGTILNFHRGTSAGSKQKTDTIQDFIKNK